MAKRGYRGKHPFNDMKVAPTSFNAANYDKLTKEYNKTGAKNKYDYIKSHDGFYPQGTAIIHFGGVATDGQTITIVSTDGTSKAYVAEDGSPTINQDPAEFNIETNAAANATSLAAAINAPEIAAVKATAVDAIDVAGHTSATGDSSFTLTISTAIGGSGTAVTIYLDDAEDVGTDHAAANVISIGCASLTDIQIAAKIILAINGGTDSTIAYATSGAGQNGVDGITASAGSGGTKEVNFTADVAGIDGNQSILAHATGFNMSDVAALSSGANRIVPGHKGKINVVDDGAGKLTLTQVEPGPHGNTAITLPAGQPTAGSNTDFLGG